MEKYNVHGDGDSISWSPIDSGLTWRQWFKCLFGLHKFDEQRAMWMKVVREDGSSRFAIVNYCIYCGCKRTRVK